MTTDLVKQCSSNWDIAAVIKPREINLIDYPNPSSQIVFKQDKILYYKVGRKFQVQILSREYVPSRKAVRVIF